MATQGAARKRNEAQRFSCASSELRAVLSWGVEKELVKERSLKLKGLTKGAAGTREGRGRRAAVDHDVVKATIPHLAEPFQTIVRLIHSTGARPSEILKLRAGDIDRSDPKQWIVVLGEHKTAAYDEDGSEGSRVLVFDTDEERALLAPLLILPPGMVLFPSPRTGRVIDHRALNRAIARACEEHEIPRWSPYMMRHRVATDLAESVDVETAQVLLGHKDRRTTEAYYIHRERVAATKAAKAKLKEARGA